MNLLNELNKTEYICCFCLEDWSDDQMFCCDTYKGIISKSEYIRLYGELD